MLRFLIVKLSSMGDVIHALPVVQDILQAYPQAQIDWVVEAAFAEIVQAHPGVHRVLPIELRRWQKNWFVCQHWRELFAFKRILQTQTYDAIFDLQGLGKSALVARWANTVPGGKRYGSNAQAAKEPWSRWLLDQPVAVDTTQPLIEQLRSISAYALGYTVSGRPRFGIAPAWQLSQQTLPVNLVPGQAFAILLHSTAAPYKLWEVQAWRDLASALAKLGIASILPWGNAAEQARAVSIAAQIPDAHVPRARYSLMQWGAWMQRARVVIGLDTGLAHLAAALDVPTIFIFGATPHWRIAPYWETTGFNTAVEITPQAIRHITLGQPEQGIWPTAQAVMQAFHQLPLPPPIQNSFEDR